MTISDTTCKEQHIGNGVTTLFPFPHKFYEKTDLVLTKTNITTNVDTPLVLNTDYTIPDQSYDNGANITTTFVPDSNTRISIDRVLPSIQEKEYTENDAFPAKITEQCLDKLTMLIQQVQGLISRSLLLPIGSTFSGITLPVPVAGALLGWNGLGDSLENKDPLSQDHAHSNLAYLESFSGENYYLKTEVDDLLGAHIISDDHDDRYYTEAEVDELVDGIVKSWNDIPDKPTLLSRPEITFVSGAGTNNCFVVADGELYSTSGLPANTCTGRGLTFNPFYGTKNFRKVNIPSSSPIVKVGGGYSKGAAWALLENKELYVWGANDCGQLGLGHTTPTYVPTLAATDVEDVYDHVSNALSYLDNTYSALFIKKSDGYIYATGYNGQGQLGLGHTTNVNTFTKITLLGTDVESVWNLGGYYGVTIVQKTNGTILAAGANTNGQLGLGDAVNRTSFNDITTPWGGGTGYKIKSAHYACHGSTDPYACLALLLDNDTTTVFKTCGHNGHGQLGDGSTTNRSTPVTPSLGSGRITKVVNSGTTAAVFHVLKADGVVYGWGDNTYGTVGDGTTVNKSTPVSITTSATNIYAGSKILSGDTTQSFIEKSTGVYAAGYNAYGQLGLGHVTTPISTHAKMLFPSGITLKHFGCFTAALGYGTFIAVDTNDRVYTWGANANNEILSGNAINCVAPTLITIGD